MLVEPERNKCRECGTIISSHNIWCKFHKDIFQHERDGYEMLVEPERNKCRECGMIIGRHNIWCKYHKDNNHKKILPVTSKINTIRADVGKKQPAYPVTF